MEVELGKGIVAILDGDMADEAKSRAWRLDKNGYALTPMRGKEISLHRLVIGSPPPGYVIDHINGDPLDNRRANLRFATYLQNSANARLRKDNKSGFKGVYRSGKKWAAQIRVLGKVTLLGSFATPEEAARVYDAKAKQVFGEFAWLNFRDSPTLTT